MSCAKIGSSAVADEKNVAKKSSSIVERMSGDRNTKRSPSSAARHDTSSFDVDLSARVGTPRIISSATITATNDTALMTYAQPTFVEAMTMPPSAGPSTCAVCCMIVLRLMAFGRSSRGTRLGTSDCRAGRSNAPTAEPSAARA